ncbi:MAG: AAA family ATPase [Magnetococcales bacterium]|nr:AAA family ATPase [Magnetococcales bacterium]
MIIQALQAENLFKFKKLSLTGLPTAGRILLSGPNESGKTAVVEAICLGLFGRTASLEASQLAKAVKWGEEQAAVTVTFSGSDDQSYTVCRYVDAKGHGQASLSQTGADEPMVKGVEAVDQAVLALAGFDFQQYMETLFLAQNPREGSAREETIQTLAGVADLDGLANALTAEMATSEAEIAQGDAQVEQLQAQLADLNLQEEALGTLERERDAAVEQLAAVDREIDRWQLFAAEMQGAADGIESHTGRLLQCGLESGLEAWQSRVKSVGQALVGMDAVCQRHHVEMDAVPGAALRKATEDLGKRLSRATAFMEEVASHRYGLAVWLGEIPSKEGTDTLHRTQSQRHEQLLYCAKRRQRTGLMVTIALLLGLLLGAAGGLLQFQPESNLASMIVPLLKMVYPAWDAALLPVLFGVAVVFLLLATNGAGRNFGLRKKMVEHEQALAALKAREAVVRQMIQNMDAAAKESLPRQVEKLVQLEEGEWVAGLAEWAKEEGLFLLDAKAQQKFMAQLQGHLETFRQEMAADAAEIAAQQAASQQARQQLGVTIEQLEAAIEQEKARRAQDAAWRAECAALAAERLRQSHQIAVRRIACTLLRGACKGLSIRFNQELRRFIAKAAPLFTQGRYQHLRIDEQLQVAAFSTAKNDFVDFDEISTGVRYQLLLAVRMALAQALAARVGRAQQFIVLDEPFVFFDRQRIRESLDALLRVSDQISQVWVIAQEYEAALAEDLHLSCLTEEDSLVYQG